MFFSVFKFLNFCFTFDIDFGTKDSLHVVSIHSTRKWRSWINAKLDCILFFLFITYFNLLCLFFLFVIFSSSYYITCFRFLMSFGKDLDLTWFHHFQYSAGAPFKTHVPEAAVKNSETQGPFSAETANQPTNYINARHN